MKDQIGQIPFRLVLRILFVLACLLAVAYGLSGERYQIYSLSDSSSRTISGPEFAEMASFDGVMRVEGKLYDIYSVAGITIRMNEKGELQTTVSSGETDKPKDCNT